VGIGLYGSVFVVPLFLGRVRGYSSMQIGETMFVTGLAMFLGAPIAGQLSARVDPRRMLAAGLVMFGVSLYWLGHLTNQSAFWEFFWPQALRGFSIMFVMLPTNTIALARLSPQQLKNASGLYNLMRNLGGAVGLAIINTEITSRLALHRQHLDEAVTWARPGVGQMVDQMSAALTPHLQGDAQTGALRRIAFLVEREALTLTYNDVLLLMSVAFFIAVPLTLFLARPAPGPAAEGAH